MIVETNHTRNTMIQVELEIVEQKFQKLRILSSQLSVT